nr:PREDICTED: phospholipase B1, membrane-associated-like [Paralichthys olivaceus]
MLPRLVLVALLSLTWKTVSGLPCSQMFASQLPPSTVDGVRPSDVAVVSSIGLHVHSTELSTVVARLTELMFMFNPALISPPSVETNLYAPQQRTLVDQAEDVSLQLRNNKVTDVDRDWKLVLLFVQVDRLCAVKQQQVQSVLQTLVEEVDEALQLLRSQVKQTIVSIALWDGEQHKTCMGTNSEGEVRLLRTMLTQSLQESLDELLVKRRWYNDRDDFTVTLQDQPLITGLYKQSGKHVSESEATQQTDNLMMQMWTNLLQPTVGQHNTDDSGNIMTLPCPAEDRPFLRTEGNSPSNSPSDVSPLLVPFMGTEMPCDDFSPSASVPTSVHELRPADIKVVAAVGDSLTVKPCYLSFARILCPCVVLPKSNSKALEMLDNMNRIYQRSLHELVESGRYDTRSDFTVVIQPFFRDIVVPRLPDGRPDRSFFSADCFHLSQKAQTLMARSLWNNMLEPLGNKTSQQDFSADIDLNCPTKTSPYIRTFNNSHYNYTGPSPAPGPITNWGSDFSCVDLVPSDTIPTSVHKLRPADIMVVAALGDSLTVGTGAKAKSYFNLKNEYKGVSWSIGGDMDLGNVTTLPNILRKFNPSLKGFSTDQGLVKKKGFNMAAPGAKTSDIPAQVQALIKAMREDKKVNFENDWKLVTIFVGGNDLCHYCVDQNNLSPKNYSHNLMIGLDMLHKEVPRLLVNVVEILEILPLRTVKRTSLPCSLLPRNSCPCLINPAENSPELEEIKRINQEYQIEIQHLISGDRYEGKEDFAVVLQPFLHNTFIPHIGKGEADPSFFSVDCFHISERAHAEMAIALWNNMLEPVGRKQPYNNFTYDRSKIHCPSQASPFVFTKKNSLPRPPVTLPPISSPTSATPVVECPSSLPVWVPVVAGVVSLLAGITVAWLLFSCCQGPKNKVRRGVEMNATNF